MKCKISYRHAHKIATIYNNLLDSGVKPDDIILKLGEVISPDFSFNWDSLENVTSHFSDLMLDIVSPLATLQIPAEFSESEKNQLRTIKDYNKKVIQTLFEKSDEFVSKQYNLDENNELDVDIQNETLDPNIRGKVEIQGDDSGFEIPLNSSEEFNDIEQDYSEKINYTSKLSDATLKDFYKGAESVMIHMQDEFKREVVASSFINLQEGTITKNEDDLNKNINLYKNRLFKNITDYLNQIGKPVNYEPIYNIGKNPNVLLLNSVMNSLPEVFSNVTENTLTRKFNNKNNLEDQRFIKAYNSFIALNNFDDMINEFLGNFIKIDNRFINVNDYTQNKYKLSINDSLTKTWKTEENISAIDEIGSLSKLLISLTPMRAYNGDLLNDGSYLSPNEFIKTMSKLKLENIARLFPNDSMKLMRISPFKYFDYTLKYIINPANENKFLDVFTRSELNIIRSAHDMFLNNNDPKDGENYSIYRTLVKEQRTHGPIYSMNVFEVILNTINNVENASYIQYAKNDNNNVVIRNILDSSDNGFKNQIESDLDITLGVMNEDSRLELKRNFEVNIGDINSDTFVEFVIPGIDGKFKYDLSGSLTFNDSKIKNDSLFARIDPEEFTDVVNNPRTPEEANTVNMLEFLDSTLNLNILSGNENLLYNYIDVTKNKRSYMDGLIKVAARTLWNNEAYIYSETNEKPLKDVIRNSSYFKNSKHNRISNLIDKNNILKSFENNIPILTNLARTKALINNENYKNNTLDLAGNSTPTTRISNLIRNTYLQYALSKSDLREDSVIGNNILYKNKYLLKDVVITADGQDRFKDTTKKSSKLNIGEIIYSSVVQDFMYKFYKDGEFLVHPTVYSDKSSHYKLLIDANMKITGIIDPFGNELDNKTLSEMSSADINKIIYSTMFSMYDKLKNNLIEDYKILMNNYPGRETEDFSNLTWDQLRDLIPTLKQTELQLAAKIARSKGNNVNLITEVHYSGGMKMNGTIDYYVQLYSVKPSEKSFTNSTYSDLYIQRVTRGKRKMLKNIIDNFPNFYLSNLDGTPNEAISFAMDNQSPDYRSNWINSFDNSLILAKYNGNSITRNNYDEILTEKNIRDTKLNIQLNPLLEKYYDLNQLISINYTSSIVGPSYNHPAKGKFIPTEQDLVDGITATELEESARQLAQYKRMVILPATLTSFIQNSINGITPKYKVSVIGDLTAPVYNYSGSTSSQDVHDGGAWSNPLINKLENNSLLDQKVGDDIKSIGHFYDPRYGTAGILKWAVFSMNNERMRMSNGSKIKLKNLFRKTSDFKWDIPTLDIMKDFKGNTLDLYEKLGERVFYKSGDNFYEIINMENVGDNTYSVEKIRVDKKGIPIGDIITNNAIIDTNFKLWQVLGGENSMSLNVNNDLEYSDGSLDNTVKFINSTGFYRTEENALKLGHSLGQDLYGDYKTNDIIDNTILDQTSVYQPMKHSMISYLVNKSAIKNGSANINNSDAYYKNSELEYFTIDTHNIGVQMNADHEADLSEVTEMSQVISAIEEKGRTHNISHKAYSDIGKIVYASVKDLMDAMTHYYQTGDKSDYYTLVGKSLVKTVLNSSNSLGLADSIINQISKDLLESKIGEIKIPFSDSSLMSLAVSNLTSALNRTAIKRKYSGIASVLVPSYDMFQLYNITETNNGISSKRSVFYQDIPKVSYDKLNTGLDLINEESLTSDFENKLWSQPQTFEDGSSINGLESDKFSNIDEYRGYMSSYLYYLNNLEKNTDETIADFNSRIQEFIENDRVQSYLNSIENSNPILNPSDLEIESSYRVMDGNNVIETVTLNTIDKYLQYRNSNYTFKRASVAENLKPSNITFMIGNSKFNIFDLPSFQNLYQLPKEGVDPQLKLQAVHAVQEQMDNLNKGYVEIPSSLIPNIINGTYELSLDGNVFVESDKIKINDISNYKYVKVNSYDVSPAELVLSKIYRTQFNLRIGDNVNSIKQQGSKFFFDRMLENVKNKTNKYDISFKRSNGNHVYVMFKNAETDKLKNKSIETTSDESSTYRIDELGNNLYKLDGIEVKSVIESGYPLEVQVVDSIDALYNLYQSETFDGIEFNPKSKEIPNIIKFVSDPNADETISEIKDILIDNIDYAGSARLGFQNSIKEQRFLLNKQIGDAAKKKYTSFLKSLEFIAARIPSQSMQSFMPMVIKEFTESEKNVAYVSHWQLWLQGSDYDIDKVYLMGSELDKNGQYIGWNKLFDLSSLERLRQSENLPTPNGKSYIISEGIQNPNNMDITEDLKNLISFNNIPLNAKGRGIKDLRIFGDFLYKIDNVDNLVYNAETVSKGVNITPEQLVQHVENLKNTINFQSAPFKDNSKYMSGIKNSVYSKIYNVIMDVRNQISAFSPVEMDDPRAASATSKSGKEARTMHADNPTTNSIMQFQNMSGKEVIGIAAVGLKIFFALSNYYNEQTRLGNIDNLVFDNKFVLDGIDIRRNMLSNINPGENTNIIIDMISNLVATGDYTIEEATQSIQSQLDPSQKDTSVTISALLSAATDNAKELILAKINAGSNLAGIYMYFMMLGVDFQTISNFMKSDTVSLINKLSSDSIFDETQSGNQLNSVVKRISEIYKERKRPSNKIGVKYIRFDTDKFLIPKFFFTSKVTGAYINSNGLDPKIKEIVVSADEGDTGDFGFDDEEGGVVFQNKEKEVTQLLSYLYSLYKKNKYCPEMKFLYDNLSEFKVPIVRMFEEKLYMDNMVDKLDQKVFEQFEKINKLSDEITVLGRILKINQGMSTSTPGLLSYIQNFEQLLFDREKEYSRNFSSDTKEDRKLYEEFKSFGPNAGFAYTLLKEKPYLTNIAIKKNVHPMKYVTNIIENADGIMDGKFNFNRFLSDDDYRKRTIDYYNLIKGTYNVFDIIDKIPHFNAMINVQNMGANSSSIISQRYELLLKIARRYASDPNYNGNEKYPIKLNDKQITSINEFFNDAIIVKWLDRNKIKFNVEAGTKIFDRFGNLTDPLINKTSIKLNNEANIASFKYWFENTIYNKLRKGITDQGYRPDVKNNRFLSDLTMALREDYSYGGTTPYLKLNLNMTNIVSEYDKLKFDQYQTDFKNLSKYTVGGVVLTDAFFLYNLFVNKNKFGPSSLTKIFSTSISSEGSIINKYFKDVGNTDWNKDMTDFDWNIEDLLYRMAPDEKTINNRIYPYTKVRNYETGLYDYSKLIDGKKVSMNQNENYVQYFMLKNPSNSSVISTESFLNEDDFIKTVKRLIANNQLQILIDCE